MTSERQSLGATSKLTCVLALGLLLGGAGHAEAQPTYVYLSLNPPGSSDSCASGINNVGQIVGGFSGPNGRQHGFLLSKGEYTTLDVPGADETAAHGINDLGQIVGSCLVGKPPKRQIRGFLFSKGRYTTISGPDGSWTYPNGINNAGQIVGHCGNRLLGFLLSKGEYTMLSPRPGDGTPAVAINNHGHVLGRCSGFNRRVFGYLYDGTRYKVIDIHAPGETWPMGINDAGDIVGAGAGPRCFVLTSTGAYKTLRGPAWAINNRGQIVGQYFHPDHRNRAYLATPIPPSLVPWLRLVGVGD